MTSNNRSRTRRVVARAIAIQLVLVACACAAVHADDTWSGRVVTVHDGDTVTVLTATARVKVRLRGIDSPEFGQHWASEARDFTASLVLNHIVIVESSGKDQYDRVLGDVRVDGLDVNEAIVRKGMAWRYDFGGTNPRLVAAERAARAERVGLWADSSPIPPWQWRRTHPRPDEHGTAASRGPNAEHGDRTPREDIRDARGPFHGNTQSHLFHRPGCPHYNCKNCDEAFLTVQSAEEAGYRPAGDCLRGR